jgi:capsular exopolysaccharide synthesis family protein
MARMSKETMLHQLRTLSPNQIEISPLVAGNASIQATRVQIEGLRRDEARMAESLGDKHPEMLRIRTQIKEAEDRLRRELSNTLRGLEAELVTAQQQESSILANMETVKRESFDINRKTVEYGVLQREVEINQELYKQLLGRSKEAGLETELKSSNVRVHEKAEMPRGPVSPNRMRNYRLALLLGLGLGIGLAVLLEHLDNTIKTPEDVKDQLNLPFLGVVPDVAARVPPVGTTSPSPLVARNPSPALAEAYRILRTNLVFSLAENTGQAIVITSASPSEGKTTTAINLAMSLAQASARVLLVEADLRRPGIHQHMGVAKAPGLTDLIVGKSEAAEAIQTTRLNGLMVIPCGHPTPNPAELLGSARMKDIVRALRSHYDWVLIDTPPILAMADTPVLCPIVDGVLLVVAAELSARPSVQRATDQIQSIGAKMLGVVLNKVDLERNSYYYGHYYGEYYRSYYGDAGKHESTRSPNIPTRPTGSGAGRAARRS